MTTLKSANMKLTDMNKQQLMTMFAALIVSLIIAQFAQTMAPVSTKSIYPVEATTVDLFGADQKCIMSSDHAGSPDWERYSPQIDHCFAHVFKFEERWVNLYFKIKVQLHVPHSKDASNTHLTLNTPHLNPIYIASTPISLLMSPSLL